MKNDTIRLMEMIAILSAENVRLREENEMLTIKRMGKNALSKHMKEMQQFDRRCSA